MIDRIKISREFRGKLPGMEKDPKFLLYGPPGVGKTWIANAVANEVNLPAFNIPPSLVWQKYLGESEKLLKKIFDEAVKASGLVIMDEFESISLRRDNSDHGARISVVALLLQLLHDEKPVFIGITNKPWMFDEAVIDRLQPIYVPPPDENDRRSIFRYYLFEKYKAAAFSEDELDYLVDLTSPREISGEIYYFTCRNIVKAIEYAAFRAAKENSLSKPLIRIEHLEESIDKIRLSVSGRDIKKYEDFRKNVF